MICPHCRIGTSPNFNRVALGTQRKEPTAPDTDLVAFAGNCTECDQVIVLGRWDLHLGDRIVAGATLPLYPARVSPRPVPDGVTDEYARDFREAGLVIQDSPKASAAVSRRLLQHVLREKGGFKAGNLNAEIDLAIASSTLPPDLAEDLDMIRTIGNFAAHPVKSTNTGTIVDVEPAEAEALLDLVEELLQHYFVRPAIRQERRNATNAKLADAGKPPLKGTSGPPSPPGVT
jgi:hypothetical protein